MRHSFLIIFILLNAFSCGKRSPQLEPPVVKNISEKYLGEFDWLNTPDKMGVEGQTLVVEVAKGTDFFNNPEDSSITASAPLLYKEVTGDFIAKALVEPDFSSQWNAVSLMVYIDSLNWIKFAFENSDATGPSVVSVATKGVSDDANGVVLNDTQSLWLVVTRKGNIFSMHWSLDDENYKMARLTAMKPANEIKIGVEFQSPVGEAATHKIHYLEIKKETVQNPRDLGQ